MPKNVKLIAIVTSLFLSQIIFACRKDIPVSRNEPTNVSALPKNVPFKIIRNWETPNGGIGKEIVIDSLYRNDSDIKLLGEELRRETSNYENVHIFIFDDENAALLNLNMNAYDKLSKDDQKIFDRHMVGDYTRSGNTTYDQLQYALQDFTNGTIKVVKY